MYRVIWRDYINNIHTKQYKNIGSAIKKCFRVYGWYKNGNVYRISDNHKIL